MKKEKFNVTGMTCSSCVAHVEKAVKELDGIQSVNVNLLLNSMETEYDENLVSRNQIIKAVISAGYGINYKSDEVNDKLENDFGENEKQIMEMKFRLIASICFLIPLMYISMHHMLYEWFKIPVPQIIQNVFDGANNAIIFAFTQFLLLIPIVFLNKNYFSVGFKRLIKKTPSMDTLIALGSSSAILYGIFAIYMIGYGLGNNNFELVNKYSMNIYFESAGMILTLITLGKYLEKKSKLKTSEAISKLVNLVPKTVTVIRDNNEFLVNTEDILLGDVIVIKPGESIPVDGIIRYGSSALDESSITGESIPVEKTVGDNVISGTINKNGSLKIEATRVGSNTTISQIIKLVEEASSSKAPISRLADKVSGVFVPCVIIIAILAFVFWLIVGQSFEFALSIGIAVLVISCPCALGLATPVAIMVATGNGAKNGILIRSAESLELLHLVDTVVLDKTGTITEGKPRVDNVYCSDSMSNNKLLQIAASLEKNSEHPLAEAVTQFAKDNEIDIKEVEEFKSIFGRGVKGKIDGIQYFGGNILLMRENNINLCNMESIADEYLNNGKTVLFFANNKEVIGIISVADFVKDTSKVAIKALQEKNLDIVMLTGDNKIVAEKIGKSLNIKNIISEVLPQDKEKEISRLQESGKRVAFVGDGINDSPALAKADVGIAIGSGTDIAIESADIVLVKNSLLDVVTAILLSHDVIKNIKMNLFWAFFYNCIGIPIAAGVFYPTFGVVLNPMIGAAAMSLSSICVVTNALRLRKFKSYFKEENVEMKNNNENIEMKKKIVYIDGMQCNHCKMSVEKVLGKIDGVTSVEVILDEKKAIILSKLEINNNEINTAITDAGFTVKKID